MKKMVLLACSCCLLTVAFAREYKVASQEDCNKNIPLLQPGDQLVIANGVYSAWEITAATIGSAGAPVIIRAETAGKVLFSGDVHNPVFKLTGAYTEIAGLVFSGCSIFKTKEGTGVLIELSASSHCRITDCVFTRNIARTQFMPLVIISGAADANRVDHCQFMSNKDNQELQVKITANAIPVHTLIDQNEFSDKEKVSWSNNNGGECIQVGQDPILLGGQYAYSLVRNNHFVKCNGEPEVISNKSSGNLYINNSFENCQGELVMRGGHDCTVDSNIFKGGSGGVRVNGTGHTISNNSFTGLPTGIRLMYGMAKGKTDTGFYIAASNCLLTGNQISNCETGILVGDSKNVDWTGKFDTTRYPSRTIQDVAPFNNTLKENAITDTKTPILHNEN